MKGKIQVSNLLKKEKGFTLIEIVLVLAIAGLLLVVVFLAVSGAQRSRRDSQRKTDVGRVAAALESYASNHDGAYPSAAQFIDATGSATAFPPYLTGINDPAGAAYTYASPLATQTPAQDVLGYTISGRTYTVCVGLEQGFSCRNNN
jgi:prepilin-type N-terminal cleavage/methylation domain-containing protein